MKVNFCKKGQGHFFNKQHLLILLIKMFKFDLYRVVRLRWLNYEPPSPPNPMTLLNPKQFFRAFSKYLNLLAKHKHILDSLHLARGSWRQ